MLAGVGVMIILIPVNALIAKKSKTLQVSVLFEIYLTVLGTPLYSRTMYINKKIRCCHLM